MRKWRAVLCGEQSGHVILEDRSTGDVRRTALRLAEVLAATGLRLSELRKVMRSYPQVLTNVTVTSKTGWDTNDAITKAVAEAEVALGQDGRILVRASGTEPPIRVMVEAGEIGKANEIADPVDAVWVAEHGQTHGVCRAFLR